MTNCGNCTRGLDKITHEPCLECGGTGVAQVKVAVAEKPDSKKKK